MTGLIYLKESMLIKPKSYTSVFFAHIFTLVALILYSTKTMRWLSSLMQKALIFENVAIFLLKEMTIKSIFGIQVRIKS